MAYIIGNNDTSAYTQLQTTVNGSSNDFLYFGDTSLSQGKLAELEEEAHVLTLFLDGWNGADCSFLLYADNAFVQEIPLPQTLGAGVINVPLVTPITPVDGVLYRGVLRVDAGTAGPDWLSDPADSFWRTEVAADTTPDPLTDDGTYQGAGGGFYWALQSVEQSGGVLTVTDPDLTVGGTVSFTTDVSPVEQVYITDANDNRLQLTNIQNVSGNDYTANVPTLAHDAQFCLLGDGLTLVVSSEAA